MKILVPIDFSPASGNAAEYAAKMAVKLNAEITLLHIVSIETPPRATLFKAQKIEEIMLNNARQDCLLLIHDLEAKTKKHPVAYEIINGFPLTDILENYAVYNDFDLIVMGTKGASGMTKVLIGSNAAAVINTSNIPVITVPQLARFHGIRRIVYASDLKNLQKEVKTLLPLVQFFNATLHILHVLTPSSRRKIDKVRILDGLLSKYKYPHLSLHIMLHEQVKEGIEEYVANAKADLLVMFTHNLGFFEKVFGKSTTREMSFHFWMPLLSIKKGTSTKRKKVLDLTHTAK